MRFFSFPSVEGMFGSNDRLSGTFVRARGRGWKNKVGGLSLSRGLRDQGEEGVSTIDQAMNFFPPSFASSPRKKYHTSRCGEWEPFATEAGACRLATLLVVCMHRSTTFKEGTVSLKKERCSRRCGVREEGRFAPALQSGISLLPSVPPANH